MPATALDAAQDAAPRVVGNDSRTRSKPIPTQKGCGCGQLGIDECRDSDIRTFGTKSTVYSAPR
jgi:hypothetical protein